MFQLLRNFVGFMKPKSFISRQIFQKIILNIFIIFLNLEVLFLTTSQLRWDVVLRLTFFPPTHPPPLFSCLVVF
jgi:hypothetical protein